LCGFCGNRSDLNFLKKEKRREEKRKKEETKRGDKNLFDLLINKCPLVPLFVHCEIPHNKADIKYRSLLHNGPTGGMPRCLYLSSLLPFSSALIDTPSTISVKPVPIGRISYRSETLQFLFSSDSHQKEGRKEGKEGKEQSSLVVN